MSYAVIREHPLSRTLAAKTCGYVDAVRDSSTEMKMLLLLFLPLFLSGEINSHGGNCSYSQSNGNGQISTPMSRVA